MGERGDEVLMLDGPQPVFARKDLSDRGNLSFIRRH